MIIDPPQQKESFLPAEATINSDGDDSPADEQPQPAALQDQEATPEEKADESDPDEEKEQEPMAHAAEEQLLEIQQNELFHKIRAAKKVELYHKYVLRTKHLFIRVASPKDTQYARWRKMQGISLDDARVLQEYFMHSIVRFVSVVAEGDDPEVELLCKSEGQ